MSELSPLSDLVADDLLLDRLASRVDAGSDPLAGLLGALVAQADTPLPLRAGRRRIGNKHRYLGAFAALAVAASGAGVAAAVSRPSHAPSHVDRALTVTVTDDRVRGQVPVAPLSRLGLPQTSRGTLSQSLVLARRDDGANVLVPAAFVPGVPAPARRDGGTPGTGATGNGRTGNGGHQGDGKQAGAAQRSTNSKKPSPATKGGRGTTKGGDRDGKDVKKPAPTATRAAVPAPSAGPTSPRPNPGTRHPGSGSVPSAAGAVVGSPASTTLHRAAATGLPTP